MLPIALHVRRHSVAQLAIQAAAAMPVQAEAQVAAQLALQAAARIGGLRLWRRGAWPRVNAMPPSLIAWLARASSPGGIFTSPFTEMARCAPN